MDYCYLGKKLSPEKSVSDRQLSREKKKSNHSRLIEQPPSVPKERSTDLSEHRTPHTNEAKTSHHKDTEHDIPQWRIRLKERHAFYLTLEEKELVSKINTELKGFREDIKTCNFLFEVRDTVTIATKEIDLLIKDISSGEMLQYTYHKIKNMRKVLSKLNKAPENIEKIRKALKTGSLPKDLKDTINNHFAAEMRKFNTPSQDTIWKHWADFASDIDNISQLVNVHNDKQATFEKTSRDLRTFQKAGKKTTHHLFPTFGLKKIWHQIIKHLTNGHSSYKSEIA
jgi:hypothetical protein